MFPCKSPRQTNCRLLQIFLVLEREHIHLNPADHNRGVLCNLTGWRQVWSVLSAKTFPKPQKANSEGLQHLFCMFKTQPAVDREIQPACFFFNGYRDKKEVSRLSFRCKLSEQEFPLLWLSVFFFKCLLHNAHQAPLPETTAALSEPKAKQEAFREANFHNKQHRHTQKYHQEKTFKVCRRVLL